jgi:uncharacterized RDD family membrane protein YckC/Tfp pilus assembly protein PilE
MFCTRCGQPVHPGAAFCASCGAPVAAPPAAPPPGWGPAPLPTQLAPPQDAGFWLRFVARLIDQTIIGLASLPVLAIAVGTTFGAIQRGARSGAPEPWLLVPWLIVSWALLALALVVGQWLYYALQERSRHQATPGKRLLGLAVTDEALRPITFGRATGRHFGKLLSGLIFDVGFLMAAFTARKQALHDLLAGTRVVRARPAGGAPLVAVVVAVVVLFGGVAATGVLAAIAIPNFVRYQLRSKAAEAPVTLRALAAAEAMALAQGGAYRSIEVGASDELGTRQVPWSREDLEAAAAIGWALQGSTYHAYRLEAVETDDGRPAWAACAESDLDGDGEVAAVIAFQPAEGSDGELVAPEAPCRHDPKLARPLEYQPGDPAGEPIPASPPDVF